jgi:hypothetical protein
MKRSHKAGRIFAILAVVSTGLSQTPPKPQSEFLSLPLSFEANQGQTNPAVKFFSRGDGYALFLTPDSAVFKAPLGPRNFVSLSGADETGRSQFPR